MSTRNRIRLSDGYAFFGIMALFFIMGCSNKDNEPGDETPPLLIDINATTYGGSLNDNAKSVVATADGGYAILGHTQSQDGDINDKQDTDFDFWLLKFDDQSTLQWTRSYGGSSNDRGNDLLQTSDGGYAIFGFSESADGDVSENGGSLDYWVAKTDASGAILWQKSLGFKGRDEGIALIQTKDSGFLLVGVIDVTASEGQGNTTARRHAGGDYWAIKLSSEGTLQWSRYFGGTFTDTAYDVVEIKEGGYLIVGSSDSSDVDITNNKGTYDFWVVRISETGELVWEKNYGGNEIDEAYGIAPADDGNYVLVGDTRSSDKDIASNHGGADIWVVKINVEGAIIWEKTFGGTGFDAGRAIAKSQTGGYILAGSSRSADGDVVENKGQNDAWILKIDDSGLLEWERSVGGSQIDLAHAVTELADGTVIVVGESASSNIDIDVNRGFTDLLTIRIAN